jgi:hypothetical protein
MRKSRMLIGALAAAALAATATMAQPSSRSYTTLEAVPGKSLRIGTYGTANKKDCSPARVPTIRVIEPPSSGSLTVRLSEAKIDKVAGCSTIVIPVQFLLYVARADAEKDRIVYEVTNASGEVATFEVIINILPRPASPVAPKPDQKT